MTFRAVPLVECFRLQCEVAKRLGEDPNDVLQLWERWGVESDEMPIIVAEVKG